VFDNPALSCGGKVVSLSDVTQPAHVLGTKDLLQGASPTRVLLRSMCDGSCSTAVGLLVDVGRAHGLELTVGFRRGMLAAQRKRNGDAKKKREVSAG